ncbi:MAG: replicative DNA helicase [Myxococcota bacterium]|jgi:replicative DNA helicase|nr:replicative DNA helicase [Myxococcota bacterium]
MISPADSQLVQALENTATPCIHLALVMKKTVQELQAAAGCSGALTGVPTGFSQLDHITGGLQRADLIVIAGRPAMGKTSLALSVARSAAKLTGQPVAFFSREASRDQLARHLLCAEGQIDAWRMLANQLNQEDWPRLVQAATELSGSPLFLDDTAHMTAQSIAKECRQLLAACGLGLVIIDCLQLLHMSGDRRLSRGEELAEILVALKELARELNVPVVVTSQLNRNLESRPDKRPLLYDLQGSRTIEVVADVILFVYRDEVYTKDECEKQGQAEIIVGKHRNGPLGTVEVRFHQRFRRFDEVVDG